LQKGFSTLLTGETFMKVSELLITASLEPMYRQAPASAKQQAEHLLKLLELAEDAEADYLDGYNRHAEHPYTVEEIQRYREDYRKYGMYALLPENYRKAQQKPIIEISKLVNQDDPSDMSLHLVCRGVDGSFVVCHKLMPSNGEYSHEWEHGRYFGADEFASALKCFYERGIELGFISGWELSHEN
jgi:hypothetical protein